MARQARVEHRLDRGMALQELGDQRGVFAVPLHAQHQRLEPAHRQIGVERSRHRARPVLQECRTPRRALRRWSAARRRRRRNARRCTSSSSAARCRRRAAAAAAARVRRRCCPPTPLCSTAQRSAAMALMSAMDSSGLVGVSTMISLVFGVIAVAHRVEVRKRHRRVVDAPLGEHLVDESEGAAVGVVGHHHVVTRTQYRAQRAVGGGHPRAERAPVTSPPPPRPATPRAPRGSGCRCGRTRTRRAARRPRPGRTSNWRRSAR